MGRKWVVAAIVVLYTVALIGFVLTALWILDHRLRRELAFLLKGRQVVNAHQVDP